MSLVYHISDLHIRKENYINLLHSFCALLKEARHEDPILVIAGDVFDTRSYLTSDDINVFTQLVVLLDKASIRTIIIPGDHDINLRALHARNNIELVLRDVECVSLGEAGPYEMDGINATIWYGDVDGAVKYNGERVTGRSPDSFDEGYVMLGGIHKHQFLTPRVAYSGSFVQTTPDEGISHGYIRWTADGGVFVPIPQKTVYLTLMAENDFCPPLPDVTPSYIAIQHRGCTDEWLASYMKHIRRNYNMSVSFIQDMDKKFKRSPEVIDMIEEDGRLVTIETLIRRILTKVGAPDEIHDDVIAMHHAPTSSKSVAWNLEYLAWSNIYCYGENNYINFCDMANLVSIVGPNKSGKSSIIDILINVLFNEYVRGTMSDVLNKSAKKGVISATFTTSDPAARYVVTKTFNSRRTQTTLTKDGVDTQLSTKEIYPHLCNEVGLGTADEFISMVTALQHRQFLVDMRKEEQMRLISRRLGLDVFNQAEATALARRRVATASIRSAKAALVRLPKDMAEDASRTSEAIAAKEARIAELKSVAVRYRQMKAELATLEEPHTAQELRDKIAVLGHAKVTSSKTLNSIESEMRALEREKHIICGAVHVHRADSSMPDASNLAASNLAASNLAASNLAAAVQFKTIGLPKLLADLKTKEDAITEFVDLQFADGCWACKANAARLRVDVDRSRTLMTEAKKLKHIICVGGTHRIKEINARLAVLEKEKAQRAAAKELAKAKEQLARVERAEVLRKELAADSVAQYTEFEELSTQLTDLTLRRRALEVKLLRATELAAELAAAEREKSVIDYYIKCIDRKTGIPALLMKSACGMLTQKCCQILGDVANFGVEFVHDKTLRIYTYDYSNEQKNLIPAVMGSGYQKFVLDLVMRIVFSELSKASNPGLLFIDEGFGALDGANFINICRCLTRIQSRFKSLILISHIDEIQTYITDFIRVTRDERLLSHVQHGALGSHAARAFKFD